MHERKEYKDAKSYVTQIEWENMQLDVWWDWQANDKATS